MIAELKKKNVKWDNNSKTARKMTFYIFLMSKRVKKILPVTMLKNKIINFAILGYLVSYMASL